MKDMPTAGPRIGTPIILIIIGIVFAAVLLIGFGVNSETQTAEARVQALEQQRASLIRSYESDDSSISYKEALSQQKALDKKIHEAKDLHLEAQRIGDKTLETAVILGLAILLLISIITLSNVAKIKKASARAGLRAYIKELGE